MNKLSALLRSEQKWKVFGLILIAIIALGTLLSLLTRITLIRDDPESRPRVAVVAPSQDGLGNALRQGAAAYIDRLNQQGGYRGRQVELMPIEEGPDSARRILADKRVVGVVGYTDVRRLQEQAPVLASARLPVVTPLTTAKPQQGVLSLGLDAREQARFVANYARNVVQQRLMYVVRESGPEFDALVEPFQDVYQRFETPVRQVWTIDAGKDIDGQVAAIMATLKDVDIGAVYLATRPALAAKLVHAIRGTGNALELFGPEQLATAAFGLQLQAVAGNDASLQSHGVVAATPVLFDTANDEAQQFQTRYQQQYGVSPDWLATLAHDAVKMVLAAKPGVDEVKGLSGNLRFVAGQAQLPIKIGVYNGERLISAPVQLQPLAKGAGFNYIDALRQGRVLYVNDRFMYKTNVVYVGVRVNGITDLDMQKETAVLDLSIWFRYRGNFNPQDLVIANAIDPVALRAPEESKSEGDLQYRRYLLKQKVRLNFTDAKRAYGQHIAGISFRHRQLNRSNLLYVVDVLGMPTGSALVDELLRTKVVSPSTGWEIADSWLSQEVQKENGDGAPEYVGLTGEQPQFSKVTLGILLKPASITARDVISGEYFIYIAIFGVLGSIAAVMLDRRKLNRYWVVQTWLLRVIFWPLLLLSTGNLVLDYAYGEFSPAATRKLVNVYESLWWGIGAVLVDIAIRRFIWFGLEASTGRKIPNVVKFFTTLLLLLLALAGIVAFVFNQALTSLLATSGLMAMVIGLAVQANIANVFSGIVLNIERPFRVGDKVKINNIVGRVIDITWRTTRIESREGQLVCLANSKVSEAEMQNFSAAPNGFSCDTVFHINPNIAPEVVLGILREAIAASTTITKDDPDNSPFASFKGVVCNNGHFVAEYNVGYRVKSGRGKSRAREELWLYAGRAFADQGLEMLPAARAG